MGFGFDKNTLEQTDSKFIKVGIQENLEVKEIKFNPAEGALPSSLEITLVQKAEDGSEVTASRKYFEPSLGEYNKTEEELEKARTKFSKIVKNFSTKFLGEQYEIPVQPSFEAFCKKAVADIGVRYKGVKVRGVIVYNNAGFPTLRAFSPVVELMSVPKEQSKLKLGDYDLVVAPSTPAKPVAQAPVGNTGLPATENIF